VKPPLILEPLRNRDFRLLWAGQTISIFGNFLHQVAVPFQLLALGASPLQLGIGVSIGTAVSLVLLLFAGAIVDRIPRRTIILASDLLGGIVVLAIATLSLTGNLRIEHIYLESAFFGASGAFFYPAIGAIIPELVPPEILVQGNALRSFSRQGARLAGPVVGGLIVASAGPGWAFFGDSLTFFVSFLALLAASPTRASATPRQPILKEIREGIAFTFSLPWLWITIVVFAFANAAYAGPLIVAMPLLVRDVLLADASVFGLINASAGIGEIIAASCSGRSGSTASASRCTRPRRSAASGSRCTDCCRAIPSSSCTAWASASGSSASACCGTARSSDTCPANSSAVSAASIGSARSSLDRSPRSSPEPSCSRSALPRSSPAAG
jgi:Bacterial protein of unknown function (DUF894).